jgi:hypothetical protein
VRRFAAALVAGAFAAGCGGESGDLMAIDVSGGKARGGELEIVIASDGRATCNDGPQETIPSDLVIDARELERDLGDLAEEGATFGGGGGDAREYIVRIKEGTVRWVEGEPGLPEALPRTQLLALDLDRLLCR